MKVFIRHRCNTKLADLGLEPIFSGVDREALARMAWFDVLSAGVAHTDFFAQRVTDYAKSTIDFSGIWD
jgi:ribonucleotide reductase beta subunit family protein with ferritin-like domain